METAVNVVWDARPSVGDRVVVVGGGVVGLLVAWLIRRIPATRVVVVDPNPAREPVAETLGAAMVRGGVRRRETMETATPIWSFMPAATRLVWPVALELAGSEAVVVEASWFGTAMVPLPLGEAIS